MSLQALPKAKDTSAAYILGELHFCIFISLCIPQRRKTAIMDISILERLDLERVDKRPVYSVHLSESSPDGSTLIYYTMTCRVPQSL
ncbi:hypothetical protein K461DRAFT_18762 [Myriangium duriaei CBS 260.36]|uniref:Uncharacterized protein n=1 Tax=Myriangium duriaei CBS 260.36 TaxID=1168546 RepID=A0A9P4J9J1_9PEZI|nr:hypothetical protein K461DRAFT_18762 [Myriangium duriaei CBS 260.36]